MKGAWEKPELIVLARSKPEEAVLQGCKAVTGFTGPNDANTGCKQAPGPLCVDCHQETIS